MALNGKERAYLRAEANGLDSEMHIGKGDITPNTYTEVADLLRTRELLKITVLRTAHISAREIADTLAKELDAAVVQVIGRKIVLYKFSEELAKKGKTKYFLDNA